MREAQSRYPELLPVTVAVSVQTLQHRLQARGREDAEGITRRLQRPPDVPPSGWDAETIDNNGPLSQGGDALVALIRQQLSPAERA